jgi:hypothetical protein
MIAREKHDTASTDRMQIEKEPDAMIFSPARQDASVLNRRPAMPKTFAPRGSAQGQRPLLPQAQASADPGRDEKRSRPIAGRLRHLFFCQRSRSKRLGSVSPTMPLAEITRQGRESMDHTGWTQTRLQIHLTELVEMKMVLPESSKEEPAPDLETPLQWRRHRWTPVHARFTWCSVGIQVNPSS